MNLCLLLLVILLESILGSQNVTKFERKNVFLGRKKRFVEWPKGSNFVISFSTLKPLLRVQPMGIYTAAYEMDVPFISQIPDFKEKLLGKKKKNTKRHVMERKYFLEHLKDLMTMMGFNGRSCINRLLCESKYFNEINNNSMLINDLIKVLFTSFLNDEAVSEYTFNCPETSCPVSLLKMFINSSLNEQ
ncbi:hypothetical protein ABEB36_002047 [Hypothenemus hampei]|uniref:Uncharacterized protein n=1 Tax=Hypothenemus hampei TaxID=57062 RepID=A0ABD1F4D3_HYPHA